jgi:signal transduction histidine kinase
MISLKVEEEEIGKIFDVDYSGKWAKIAKLAGTGMGMNIALKLIDLNNGKLEFLLLDSEDHLHDEFPYNENRIVVTLPIYIYR